MPAAVPIAATPCRPACSCPAPCKTTRIGTATTTRTTTSNSRSGATTPPITWSLGDAYFRGMDFFLQIGRKIARDYYGCRGVFIQLSGYPIHAEDDPLGVVPMGRMAYMTGWAVNQYWWRYLVTLDADWLRATGYPVLRDAALFYTDFLQKGEDGLYHAFPSNQGEDGFSGNPQDYTDRTQVMQHLRYCLRAAILASEVLQTDAELREQWRDRLEHCAGDDGRPPLVLTGIDKLCADANPPEFGLGRPFQPQPATHDGKPWPESPTAWYFGQYPWMRDGPLASRGVHRRPRFPRVPRHRPAMAASQRPDLGHGRGQLRTRRRVDGIARRDRAAAGDDAAELGRGSARVSRLAPRPGGSL